MLKSHEKFHSLNGKRLILVVDDEAINRDVLGMMLEEEYEIIYAADGKEGMEKVLEYKDTLSLVLLDLIMPVMTGMELLRWMKESADGPV